MSLEADGALKRHSAAQVRSGHLFASTMIPLKFFSILGLVGSRIGYTCLAIDTSYGLRLSRALRKVQ